MMFIVLRKLPIFIGNFREGDLAADELDLGDPLGAALINGKKTIQVRRINFFCSKTGD